MRMADGFRLPSLFYARFEDGIGISPRRCLGVDPVYGENEATPGNFAGGCLEKGRNQYQDTAQEFCFYCQFIAAENGIFAETNHL